MFDDIKNTTLDTTIFIKDAAVKEFTGTIKFKVSDVRLYSTDDCELAILEFGDYHLIAYCSEDNPHYFIYELQNSGSLEDLMDNGYDYINDDDEFRKKIVVCEESKNYSYKHSYLGALYDLNIDRTENCDPATVSICEYICKKAQYSHIFIEHLDDDANIFTGFEIKGQNIKPSKKL